MGCEYSLQVTTPPAAEPITLAEAKLHLRVDHAEDDTYITTLIEAARDWAECFTSRAIITQTFKMYLRTFPGFGGIVVPRAPVISLTSIIYYDQNNTLQTLDPAVYETDFVREPGRIDRVFGQVWPSVYPRVNAVCVEFVAGYGAAGANVPAGLRRAILQRLTELYEDRQPTVYGAGPSAVKSATSEVAAMPYFIPV